MGYYSMCSWAGVGWGLLKVLMFILASFLFAIIFWVTQRWLDDLAKKHPKKKKK